MKKKRSKLISMLLTLVMTLSLVPAMGVTASAADNHPEASNVFVDGGKSFYNNRLYYKKGDQDKNFTGNEGDYIAHYNPATGTLTLNGYSGGSISVGGVKCSDITVVLKGTNTINGSLENAVGGDITVTSSDGGTLSISKTTSGSNPAIGIETGLSGSYTTGNVTIKGNAKVTINMTHNGTSTYEKAYGIFAKEKITISENASVDITCATPNNTTGGGNCNGLYAAKDVTIDTNGTIKIDVTNAGKDNGYSYGVYHMGAATLTKVGNMEVQWKKESNNTRYSGGAFTRGATFSDTDHAINEDTTNCYASYRYGTSYYTVTVQNGTLTGTGVKYANGSGKFLAGDMVNITPATKKGRSGEEIPFKEWTFSDVMLDKSATTASNSFIVPSKDVTVTATHSPFVGTPTFTPIGTTGTQGTLTFKTVVKADDAYEGFRLVKEGDENNESSYISIRSDTTSTSSPYEYSHITSIYNLDKGNYYVVAYLGNQYYLSDLFTVNYTAAPATKTLKGISVTTAPNKTIYTAGDNFDSTGMVVTAEYSNGDTAEVTSYTVTDGNNLTEGKTSVTISYTENGETKTCTQDITVNAAAHTHTWETGWSKDEMQHWHKCTGCDAKKDVANHSGGTATCTAQAECLVCGVSYGALNPNNHSGTTGDWKTNESQHWKVYNCCNAEAEKANHVYDNDKDTTCNTCGYVRTIAPTKIAVPTAKTGLVYDGNEKIGVEAGEGYTLSGTFKATGAGDYTATAALETDYKWNDGTTDDKIISWSIDRAVQEAPSGLAGVAPTTAGGSDGKITGTTADMEYSTDAAFASKFDCADTETTGLEAGTYYVRYKEKTNYYAGTAATVTVGEGTPVATYTLTVNEGTGSGDYAENVIVTIQANEAATGKQFKEWTGLDSVEFVDSTSKTSATAKFKMPAEAVTATATYEDVVIPVEKIAAIPTAKTGLVYDGNEKTGVETGEGYTLSGTFKATDAGDYTATAALETDYKWNNGTTDDKIISWSIDRAVQEAPSGLAGVAPTTAGGSDGKITGTTADMEYSTDAAFASKFDCADTETTGLEAGTYYVRYKEKTNYYAGTAATVTVGEGTPVATYTLTVNEGTGSGDYAENVIVTIQANEAATGKQFKEWTGLDSVEFVDSTSKTSATAKFKMPAEAVTATATYEDVVIPPSHTHTYDGTWKFDENKHWKECADTSCDNLTGSVKEEAPHSFAEVVTPATPTTDGKKESKCSVCGYVGKTETINATGYKITFDAKGGTLTATELHTDRTGKLASLPTATRSGYTFDGWFTAETGGEKVTTEKTFNANITLYAHWTAKSGGSSGGGGGGGGGSATKYAVTVSSADNGKVTSDKTSVARGNLVTITAKANDGYVLDTIKVTDKDGKEIKLTDKSNGKYTFAMPASKVEVKAVFKQTESKPDKPAEEIKTVVVMQVGSKTMFVNGKSYEKDAAPVIINDRTLVPIRFVTESLGGEVKWNAETKEVTLVIDGKEIKMTIGKNLEKYGVAPVIISDRTFVPVRFVADELGAETEWDDTTKTVTITKTVTEK